MQERARETKMPTNGLNILAIFVTVSVMVTVFLSYYFYYSISW